MIVGESRRVWGRGYMGTLYLPLSFAMNLKLFLKKKKKREDSLVAQWVKDLVLSLQWLGHCCGMGLIPGLGTSMCQGDGQEINK